MKIKSLLIGMLACSAMVACTNEDSPVNGENNDGMKNFVTKITLNFPDANNGSRAYDPDDANFEDGIPAEYSVKDVTVKFYDANKNFLGEGTIGSWSNNADESVTQSADVTFRSVSQPYYAIAYVNDPTSTLTSTMDAQNIAGLKTLTYTDTQLPIATTADLTNGFFMTNSSYKGTDGEIVQEVNVSGATMEVLGKETLEKVKQSEAYAALKAAEIYVERVVAKVDLAVDLSGSATNKVVEGEPGLYQLKYADTNGQNQNDYSDYAIKVVDWKLNATNKNFYALKNIEKGWANTWYGDGRSFWAIDNNYGSGTYLTDQNLENLTTEQIEALNLSLNYYKLSEINGEIGVAQYCYENTLVANAINSAATHVVLKAQYFEKGSNNTWAPVGADDYIYRINQKIYNAASIKALIANVLISKYNFYANSEATTAMDAATLVNSITLTVNAEDVDAIASISLVDGVVAKTKTGETFVPETGWTAQFNGGTIIGYKGGYCYYTIPIKHFLTAEKGELGHYGVVRNHWYQLTVSSIAGFGEPGSNKPIIPEEQEELKDWVVKCNININAWAKVTQGNITVGGGTNAWD